MRHFARKGQGVWRQVNRYVQRCAPSEVAPWLFDSGSLTAKLKQKSQGELSVVVLRQTCLRANLSESCALGISPRSYCLVREVVLRGPQGVPWVFARSIFPMASLTGPLRHLRRMGSKPLGAYLFSQPALKRSSIQIAELAVADGEVPALLQKNRPLWGRRSIFTLFGRQILVSEIFLPGLMHA